MNLLFINSKYELFLSIFLFPTFCKPDTKNAKNLALIDSMRDGIFFFFFLYNLLFFLSFSDVLLWHLLQELSSTVCTRLRESPSVKLHPVILYLAVHVSDIFFFSPIVTDINHLVLFFHLLKIHLHFSFFFLFHILVLFQRVSFTSGRYLSISCATQIVCIMRVFFSP